MQDEANSPHGRDDEDSEYGLAEDDGVADSEDDEPFGEPTVQNIQVHPPCCLV